MQMSNRERIERALDLLRAVLAPYVERELETALREGRLTEEQMASLRNDPQLKGKALREGDTLFQLNLMNDVWPEVFQPALGFMPRSLVNEMRDWRNQWAHQNAFSSEDTLRALDTARRLLEVVGAADQAGEINRLRQELQRQVFEEQRRSEARKRSDLGLDTPAGLRPWREVITPHEDVLSGNFQQAEFAADLWQVCQGEGPGEYRDPREFFRRTHLTESLRRLLLNAVRRLSGRGGEPVIQLQTNFGGGKTHSLLALYHLFGPEGGASLPGLDDLLREAGPLPDQPVRRVVVVGNRLSPGRPERKPDGTEVRTLWGEIAWQLGGAEGYRLVAEDDLRATSPGDALRELIARYAPCLILIDEWVAYARELHDTPDLPGGSFETQFTFAQTLTESARLVPNAMVVISLPASATTGSPHTLSAADEMEVGGPRGAVALNSLKHVIGRVESFWRPASMEESFLIVRKRLFNELPPDRFRYRDDTARTFVEYYRQNKAEFPAECAEPAYEERIRSAYPIHPEVFDRLFTDWGALSRFQRTRGVLRFMAQVIHTLWESNDQSPLILPCTIPMDCEEIQSEMSRYLEERWSGVLESDVDGNESTARKIDREYPHLGRVHAAQRAARTVFFGSAPTLGRPNKGLDERGVRLGCAMPGESLPHFGDALRKLQERAYHLYADGGRYWFDVRPTLTRVAQDLASQLRNRRDLVLGEIEGAMQDLVRKDSRNAEVEVVCCPRNASEIADSRVCRLVILGPAHGHVRNQKDTPALNAARDIFERRGGNLQRIYRNTLVFLAPDEARLKDLCDAACRWMAWDRIRREHEERDLTASQKKLAENQSEQTRQAFEAQFREVWTWLLVPEQPEATAEVTFRMLQVSREDTLVRRAVRKLREEDLLVSQLSGSSLRDTLDKVPLWRGNHVSIRELLDYYASYPYLDRLTSPVVLLRACKEGVASLSWEQDGFACADSFDETAGRYRNLRYATQVEFSEDTPCLLVRPEVARAQIQAESAPTPTSATPAVQEALPREGYQPGSTVSPASAGPAAPAAPVCRQIHATRQIDPLRVARETQKIDEEVLQHLKTRGKLRITLEIHAELPEGLPEPTARVIRENCNALGIQLHLE